jgi:hypothetical protein
MATNWTDATLFVDGDVALPENLTGLTATADINFQDEVKIEIGKEIRYRYHDYPNFDIEEITDDSITDLKETALFLNLHYICRQQLVNGGDADTYGDMSMYYFDRYLYFIKRDVELMEFDEPDGINDSEAFTIPVKR